MGSSGQLTKMCSTDTHLLWGSIIKIKVLHPVTLRFTITLFKQVVWNTMTHTVTHSFSWQFTDSTAGNDPDLGDVVQASGPGGEDPAFVEVGALLEQATSQD